MCKSLKEYVISIHFCLFTDVDIRSELCFQILSDIKLQNDIANHTSPNSFTVERL
jgi:hypothetical protein